MRGEKPEHKKKKEKKETRKKGKKQNHNKLPSHTYKTLFHTPPRGEVRGGGE